MISLVTLIACFVFMIIPFTMIITLFAGWKFWWMGFIVMVVAMAAPALEMLVISAFRMVDAIMDLKKAQKTQSVKEIELCEHNLKMVLRDASDISMSIAIVPYGVIMFVRGFFDDSCELIRKIMGLKARKTL